jgi:hypothetical protein
VESKTVDAVEFRDGQRHQWNISVEMIAFGRERAAATGFENIEFVQSDAASLDSRQLASMPRCHAGGSSSSPTQRPPRHASVAS